MKMDIQQLLQECLEGYDAGLTPEECLCVYTPEVRVQLEPLFRQALSLRVAYAASPREEFRHQTREKLLFAAGRDVAAAMSADPDPDFVSSTRQRLLNRAGAGAQEALRDVPPPRLPFWVNARRHLLETAAAGPPKPAPRVAAIGIRSALSAAIVVLAVAVAGAGFMLQDSPANQPSLAAELSDIQRGLDTVEQLRASGEALSAMTLLNDLSIRTSRLAEQYSEASPNSELKEKLPGLIDRQQTLLAQEDSLDESLAAAQERLNEADERFTEDDESDEAEPTGTPDEPVAAASATEPSEDPTSEPTSETTPEATATEPAQTQTPDIVVSSPSDLEAGQVAWQYDDSFDVPGVRWWRVTTSALTFVMPEAWVLEDVERDENGIAVLPTSQLIVSTDVNGMMLIVSNVSGEVHTAVDGVVYTLRDEEGTVLSANEIAQLTGLSEGWDRLYNMLLSLEVVEQPATATPEASATPSPSATLEATPTPTNDDADSE